MFYVDNKPVYEDVVSVIKKLKAELEQKGIIRFRDMKLSGDNLMVTCPNKNHSNGNERRPSCGILVRDKGTSRAGSVHCFTCGYIASLEELVSDCFGYMDKGKFGKEWLIRNFVTYELDGRKFKLEFNREEQSKAEAEYVSEEELAKYRYVHPYMYRRKLTDEVIEIFDVGYDRARDCITFPVRDINGNTLFVGTRQVKYKQFIYPKGSTKPVYGLYEIKDKPIDRLWICESQFNALTCWVYGEYGVALMGTGDSYQYEQLRDIPCRTMILALDPDEAGNKGCKKLFKALDNKTCYRAKVPVGKDINDLTKEEFDNLELDLLL